MTGPGPAAAEIERYRRCLAEGRYMMSEHVVRSLMSGQVRVDDIRAAIGRGTVIEVHENAKRGTSHLLAVLGRGGPIHVMCAEGVNGWMVVVFAYSPAQPVWATPGRRNPRGMRGMSGKFTNCYFCGGEIKTVTVGNFDYRKEGKLYVIKKVPAGLCLECGEKYIDPEVGQRMDALIEAQRFTAIEPVDVIEFNVPDEAGAPA